MEKNQKIFKAGNSLAVSLPARVVNSWGLASGQTAICKIDLEEATITFEFPEGKQLSLLGRTQREK